MGSSPNIHADDPKPDQDALNKERELDLKEREVAAREREVLAKEEELKRSRWLNPTVIGLFAAALGLLGSVIVARVNNANTQAVERLQSEANITLEAIRTGTGNTDAACKNLTFFVSLGLIHDPEGKIAHQCVNAPLGPPSLPTSQSAPQAAAESNYLAELARALLPNRPVKLDGEVTDLSTHQPIAGADVTVVSAEHANEQKTRTNVLGIFSVLVPTNGITEARFIIKVTKNGYAPYVQVSAVDPASPVGLLVSLKPEPAQ